MANLDITRHLYARKSNYTGVRVQQGRTLLDSDWNEDALLSSEERRLTLADLIGAQGSSNAGFAVTDVVEIPATSVSTAAPSASHFDFRLLAGSMFVGGMRLVVDAAYETFRAQQDWLQQDLAELPTQPTPQELAPIDGLSPNNAYPVLTRAPKYRYDLVYLEAWEQPVTAVEDSELRERALGGPDSSARIRRMRRVYVQTDVGTDSAADAFAALDFEGGATLDPATHELVSNALLTVTPVPPAGLNPCEAQPPSGYVGHEDQAIRVELRGGNKITWGFGNAAPLYRVKVDVSRSRVTFLTKPRDVRRQPKSGQIIEIIPWGAKLPNDEKVAELQGELFRALDSYDSTTGELLLDGLVPETWTEWLADARDHWNPKDGDDATYFYLRVWDRGADTSSDPLIEIGATPVELGRTGLQVSLTGTGRTSDYWVIAARRATPDQVVPWQLLSSEAPHGPRRFAAPIAVIRWEAPLSQMMASEFAALDSSKYFGFALDSVFYAVWGPVKARVFDARGGLDPLCLGACCTITVGDGVTSFGVVDDLQDAINLLPTAGGRICLLPGEHKVAATATGRDTLEIYGSGLHCRLVNKVTYGGSANWDDRAPSLITLVDCNRVKLRNFSVTATAAIGVEITGTATQDIVIEDVEFTQTGFYVTTPSVSYGLPQPAVLALGGDELVVRGCRVKVDDVLSYAGALVLGGRSLRILDNYVQGGDFESASIAGCMGGIHILSQSEDVEVSGNVVHGGWGYGIALGHVIAWQKMPVSAQVIYMSNVWAAADRGLGEPVSNLFGYEPVGGAPIGYIDPAYGWTSAGALVDVRIDRNRISHMGLSGISTSMMKLEHTDSGLNNLPAFIVINGLSITKNVVTGNRRASTFTAGTLFDPRGDGTSDIAIGGIVISAAINAIVAENRVVDNGTDPAKPNCGLGFIAMQHLIVRDNYVVDNGGAPGEVILQGLRGGIAVMEVSAARGSSSTYIDTIHYNVTLDVQPAAPVSSPKRGLHIFHNEVSQRCGKALWIRRVFDGALINENSLFGKGDPAPDAGLPNTQLEYVSATAWGVSSIVLAATGACVEVVGLSPLPGTDWSVSPAETMLMVDPGADATLGGVVEFSGNVGELDWTNPGGHACAFLLSSLDSVSVTDNALSVNMHGGTGTFSGNWIHSVLNAVPVTASFLITNTYAGALGAVVVKGNRFCEGELDAFLSAIVGPALQPADSSITDLRSGAVYFSSVASHSRVLDTPSVGEAKSDGAMDIRIYEPSPAAASLTHYMSGPTQLVKISY